MLLSIWDDGYGISVPNEFQMTKGDISQSSRASGTAPAADPVSTSTPSQGWDYPALCETYLEAPSAVRREHVPAIIHVTEMTQPLGHSTSGSHERYKSKERLAWEKEFDCLRKMREWILDSEVRHREELDAIEEGGEGSSGRERERRLGRRIARRSSASGRTRSRSSRAVAERSARAEHIRGIAEALRERAERRCAAMICSASPARRCSRLRTGADGRDAEPCGSGSRERGREQPHGATARTSTASRRSPR